VQVAGKEGKIIQLEAKGATSEENIETHDLPETGGTRHGHKKGKGPCESREKGGKAVIDDTEVKGLNKRG